MDREDADIEAVRGQLVTLNSAWQGGEFIALAAIFHPHAVIIGPGGEVLAQGRDACIDSYREFTSKVETNAYGTHDPVILVHEDTAVVRQHFHIVYCPVDGEERAEEGAEELVFVRDQDDWLILWRGMMRGNHHAHGDQDVDED